MRRVLAVAAGLFLSVFLVAAVNAAPGQPPENPQIQKEKGGKKAMQAKRDREKQVQETKKKAAAMKQQSQSGK
jgi:hypothetical protein